MLYSTTDPGTSIETGRAMSIARPESFLRPLVSCALALAFLASTCDVHAASAAGAVRGSVGAPVEERDLPPLLTPPGAIADPAPGEAAAPDPLVSDADTDVDAAPTQAPPPGFREPTFARSTASGVTATPRGAVEADAAGVLFGQLQDLQQEVMMLRGLVEAQQNTIDRLSREQRERYLDLDRRLSMIGTGEGAGRVADTGSAVGAPGESGTTDPLAAGEPMSEQAAYEQAFGLTRDKRFEEAIPAFRRLIEDHPDGVYTPNAWYWLGELYLALPAPDLERARQAFVQVIQLWPDNRKAPDAKYKLGVVYDRLGEAEQARTHLEQVLTEHPDSPAARLASSYLDQIEG